MFKNIERVASATAVSAFLALTLAFSPEFAYAETSEELQERVNEAYAQLASYTAELEVANSQLESVTEKLEDIREQIEETQDEIAEKEAEVGDGQEVLSVRLAQTYKTGGNVSVLTAILNSTTFSELYSTIYYANLLAENDTELIQELQAAQDELQAKYDELSEQEAEQEQLVSDQQDYVDEVNGRLTEQQEYYESLDEELQEQLAEEEAVAAAQAALEAQQEEEAESSSSSSSSSNSSSSSSSSGDSSSGGSSSSSSSVSGSSVVEIALAQVGKPYVWAAAGPDSFDCSGLVVYCYAQLGISLPHSSQSLYNRVSSLGNLVYSVSELSPGDLVFWGYSGSGSSIYHVGIYIGNGKYVHASMPGVGVVTATLSTGGNFAGGGSPV